VRFFASLVIRKHGHTEYDFYKQIIKAPQEKLRFVEGSEKMRLEDIKQVVDVRSKATANDLLGKGWVLLDAKVVQLGNKEGVMQGGTMYILGEKQKQQGRPRKPIRTKGAQGAGWPD